MLEKKKIDHDHYIQLPHKSRGLMVRGQILKVKGRSLLAVSLLLLNQVGVTNKIQAEAIDLTQWFRLVTFDMMMKMERCLSNISYKLNTVQ